MNEVKQSVNSSIHYRYVLASASILTAIGALTGAWVIGFYQQALLLNIVIAGLAAWSLVCNQARGFVYGRIFNVDWGSIIFVIIGILSPGRMILIYGLMVGILLYSTALAFLAYFPKAELAAGDRFYRLVHPFDAFMPMTYLAPQRLSPVFDPKVAYHWKPGLLGIPLPVMMLIDPPSVHDFIAANARLLAMDDLDWDSSVGKFRNAVRILSLLGWIGKYETGGLDGAALAAAARLALYRSPDQAKETLRDALSNFRKSKRTEILDAFDLGQFAAHATLPR